MIKKHLRKRALDLMNRALKFKSELHFCSGAGDLPKEMNGFLAWLGDYLLDELQRETWEEPVLRTESEGRIVYLYPSNWRLRADEFVGFSFWWPYLFEEPPAVMLRIPAEDLFPPRNPLIKRLWPKLRRMGFIDHWDDVDPDPSCPRM